MTEASFGDAVRQLHAALRSGEGIEEAKAALFASLDGMPQIAQGVWERMVAEVGRKTYQ